MYTPLASGARLVNGKNAQACLQLHVKIPHAFSVLSFLPGSLCTACQGQLRRHALPAEQPSI